MTITYPSQPDSKPTVWHCMSDEALTDLLRKAARPEQLISAQSAAERFEISAELLKALVREGKIGEYHMADHSKIVRYSVNEIIETFKPKQI